MINFLVNCPVVWAIPLLLIIYIAAINVDDKIGPKHG